MTPHLLTKGESARIEHTSADHTRNETPHLLTNGEVARVENTSADHAHNETPIARLKKAMRAPIENSEKQLGSATPP